MPYGASPEASESAEHSSRGGEVSDPDNTVLAEPHQADLSETLLVNALVVDVVMRVRAALHDHGRSQRVGEVERHARIGHQAIHPEGTSARVFRPQKLLGADGVDRSACALPQRHEMLVNRARNT